MLFFSWKGIFSAQCGTNWDVSNPVDFSMNMSIWVLFLKFSRWHKYDCSVQMLHFPSHRAAGEESWQRKTNNGFLHQECEVDTRIFSEEFRHYSDSGCLFFLYSLVSQYNKSVSQMVFIINHLKPTVILQYCTAL